MLRHVWHWYISVGLLFVGVCVLFWWFPHILQYVGLCFSAGVVFELHWHIVWAGGSVVCCVLFPCCWLRGFVTWVFSCSVWIRFLMTWVVMFWFCLFG